MKKRILSILLVLCMIVNMVPATVFATDESMPSDTSSVIDQVNDSDDITQPDINTGSEKTIIVAFEEFENEFTYPALKQGEETEEEWKEKGIEQANNIVGSFPSVLTATEKDNLTSLSVAVTWESKDSALTSTETIGEYIYEARLDESFVLDINLKLPTIKVVVKETKTDYEKVVELFEALPSAKSITEETTQDEGDRISAQVNAALDALDALEIEDYNKFQQEQKGLLEGAYALYTTLTSPPIMTLLQGEIASDEGMLQSAINNVSDGGTITISQSITLSNSIEIPDGMNKSFTIDLNGYKIECSNMMFGNTILHKGTGILTIDDTSASGGGTISSNKGNVIVNESEGSVIISGGKVENTSSSDAIFNNSNGAVIISGGTVSTFLGDGIVNNLTGSVTVSEGTVQSSNIGVAILNNSGGSVTISGGTVKNIVDNAYVTAILNNSSGTVTVSGGTVSANSGRAISNNSTGKITVSQDSGNATLITSANISVSEGTIYLHDVGTDTDTRLEILGGTVENTFSGNAIANNSSGAVIVSGGTVSTNGGDAIFNNSSGAVIISGGTVSATPGIAIRNKGTGKITISQGVNKTTSITSENPNFKESTIYLDNEKGDNADTRLEITGGTVSANGGYTIFNNSDGAVIVSGGTVISTKDDTVSSGIEGDTIFNNFNGAVIVSGGTVSSTTRSAISNKGTGKITISEDVGKTTLIAGTSSDFSTISIGDLDPTNDTCLEITGGTVSATTGIAIESLSTGKIIISQAEGNTTLITSENKIEYLGTISLGKVPTSAPKTILEITGGTVSNTAITGEQYAVYFSPPDVMNNLFDYYSQTNNAIVGKIYPPRPSEITPAATFTATGVDSGELSGLTADASYKYSLDSGTTWTDFSGLTTVTIASGITTTNGIQVVKKGNGTTSMDSDAQLIHVTKANAPTGIGKSDATSLGNDGTITGVTNAMEYRLSTAMGWTDITGNSITGLCQGTYNVRIKASGTELASDNISVTIKALSSLWDAKFYRPQLWDCQRSPAFPRIGKAISIYALRGPYTQSLNDIDFRTAIDRYVQFKPVMNGTNKKTLGDLPNATALANSIQRYLDTSVTVDKIKEALLVEEVLYEHNGTRVATQSEYGIIFALTEDGFLYISLSGKLQYTGGVGTFVSTKAQNPGDRIIITPMDPDPLTPADKDADIFDKDGDKTEPESAQFDLIIRVLNDDNTVASGKAISFKYGNSTTAITGTTDTKGEIKCFNLSKETAHNLSEINVDAKAYSGTLAVPESGIVVLKLNSSGTPQSSTNTITYTQSGTGNGKVTANSSEMATGNIVTVPTGSNYTQFVFTAEDTSYVSKVTIDGTENPTALTNGYYDFSNLTSNSTIDVEFTPDPTYSISGTITGSDTSSGIAATLQLKDSTNANVGSPVTADSNGSYTITSVPAGNDYTIEVSHSGYSSGTIPSFNVLTDMTGKDLTLQKISVSEYVVSYSLLNITAKVKPTTVNSGATLNVTLAADNGYELPDSAITVKMGGVALIPSKYSYNSTTGILTIAAVVGDIEIQAGGAKITTPPATEPTSPLDPDDAPVVIVTPPSSIAAIYRLRIEPLTEEQEKIAETKLQLASNAITEHKDIELQISTDSGVSWRKATAAEIKDGKAKVLFPLPAGTSSSTHTFKIYHYADPQGVNGTATPLVTTVEDSLAVATVTVSSFSPFTIVATPKSTGGGNTGGGNAYTTYIITATAGAGGRINTGKYVSVREGDSTRFIFTPNKGYEVADVLVNGKSIGAVASYTFTNVRSNQTIEVRFKISGGYENPQTGLPFEDVSEKDWFYEMVYSAVNKGLFVGTSDTTFSPHLSTTRGMIATILYRMEKEPLVTTTSIFEDVKQGEWYHNGVVWGTNYEIVKGYGNGKYGPNDNVTREQLAAILYRYAGFKGYDVSKASSLDTFVDSGKISEYAVSSLKWAVANGLVSGKGGGILDPKGKATRSEVATILVRFEEVFSEDKE